MDFGIIIDVIKFLNFPCFLGKWGFINWLVIIIFFILLFKSVISSHDVIVVVVTCTKPQCTKGGWKSNAKKEKNQIWPIFVLQCW